MHTSFFRSGKSTDLHVRIVCTMFVLSLFLAASIVYDPNDPAAYPIIPKFWKPIKPHNKWVKWQQTEPDAGRYIFARDTKSISDIELMYTMGFKGSVIAVLPCDPGMNKYTEEEYQYVSRKNN